MEYEKELQILTISARNRAIENASTKTTVQYITSTSTCADTAIVIITVEACPDNDGNGIPDVMT